MERVSDVTRAERHHGHGRRLRRQQRRRPVAAGAPVPAEGRGVRRGRRAVRGRREEVQPRLVHHHATPGGRRAGGGGANSASQAYARGGGAGGEGAPDQGAAHRLHPHVDRHAGRGLVADGVRPPEDPVRLHQHAGDARRSRTSTRSGTCWCSRRSGAARSRSSAGCRCGATRCRGRRRRSRRTSARSIRPTTCGPASAGAGWSTSRTFVRSGGVLIVADDTTTFASRRSA